MQEFQELYEKYSRYVYHFLLKLTNSNADLADELTQETFFRYTFHFRNTKEIPVFSPGSAELRKMSAADIIRRILSQWSFRGLNLSF
ncbi:hypothetical protein LC724_13330 [Blautia sp. RD014234]|nr:hypothetical protein [Blautia parvula]